LVPSEISSSIRSHGQRPLGLDRKNQRSTRQGTHIEPDRDEPISSTNNFTLPTTTTKTFEWYCAITEPTGQIYTDQTGRFILPSSTGNNYLMILYDYDSNHIFVQPMKIQQGLTIVFSQ
jgi:hypothetical protein